MRLVLTLLLCLATLPALADFPYSYEGPTPVPQQTIAQRTLAVQAHTAAVEAEELCNQASMDAWCMVDLLDYYANQDDPPDPALVSLVTMFTNRMTELDTDYAEAGQPFGRGLAYGQGGDAGGLVIEGEVVTQFFCYHAAKGQFQIAKSELDAAAESMRAVEASVLAVLQDIWSEGEE